MKTSDVAGVVLCLATLLSGCDVRSGTAQPPSPSEPFGMKERLNEMEKTGELPALDRSTDIAGPDADHNGIRDEADACVAAMPVSEAKKWAAPYGARERMAGLADRHRGSTCVEVF